MEHNPQPGNPRLLALLIFLDRMTTAVANKPYLVSAVKRLARPPLSGPVPRLSYDASRQVSRVWEGQRWVDSWEAATLSGTKKFDVETGEDAKGR